MSNSIFQPLMCGTADMPDITAFTTNNTKWYILDGVDLSGSCSWNQTTNETTFTLSGAVLNSSGCRMPFVITYSGV